MTMPAPTKITLPDATRLDDLLQRACEAHGDKLALIGNDERHTYGDLRREGTAMAEELGTQGLRADEPVLAVVKGRPLDLAAWYGVWRVGGVVVPVHGDVPAPVFEELQRRTGARYVVRGAASYPWPAGLAGGRDASGRVARIASEPPPARPLLAGAALVVFTSGSTGRPKGVVLGHSEFTGKLRAIQEVIPFRPDERTLLILQLTFSFGQWVSLLTLATGGQLYMLGSFHPVESLEALANYRIDRVAAVPTMMRAWLANRDAEPGLERLRQLERPGLLAAGGEVLSAALGTRLRERLPATGIADVFGLTETNTSDFILPPTEYDRRAGSIGWPSPGVSFRLANEAGEAVPAGQPGELQIRTPFRMRGYFDDPETTAATFHGDWLRTGDVGRLRDDGTVELVGRQKDLIVRGANKISPLEIEAALVAHPAVEAALAAGVPDNILGERIHLMVVLKRAATATEAELREFAASRLEKFKIPDRIHFVDSLPLGRTGKADRATMRTLLTAPSPG